MKNLKNLFLTSLILTGIYAINRTNAQDMPGLRLPAYYAGVQNTGNNMTLGIPFFAWDTPPSAGDEIGAFSEEGKLIGSTVFIGENLAVTIWGDDETTRNKDGMGTGKKFTLRLWRHDKNIEELIIVNSWLEGDDIYDVNGISVAEKIGLKPWSVPFATYRLEQNIPNPAKESTRIEFFIPEPGNVTIRLFTSDGKLLKDLLAENKNAGIHQIELAVGELAPGTYYYTLTSGSFTGSKPMKVIR
jgi:hypothetical protein